MKRGIKVYCNTLKIHHKIKKSNQNTKLIKNKNKKHERREILVTNCLD